MDQEEKKINRDEGDERDGRRGNLSMEISD
jgi:hypothetical protein